MENRPALHAHPTAWKLSLRVWHMDPLRCPICQSPMRVIAVIDDSRLVEKILRHIRVWHDPPASLSEPGATRPYTYEPCGAVDPMPDYENLLMD